MNDELIERTLEIAKKNDTANAIAMQRELTGFVRVDVPDPEWNTVAGVDLSYEDGNGYAVIVVVERGSLAPLETVVAKMPVTFPYIPGFLAFRELPAFFDAYRKLKRLPDVWMFDGQGLAHPRGWVSPLMQDSSWRCLR
jgi:deoxyribonuclease V